MNASGSRQFRLVQSALGAQCVQQYCCTHIPALLHLDQSEAAHRIYYVSGSKVQCLGCEHADHCAMISMFTCQLQSQHPNGSLLQENHI